MAYTSKSGQEYDLDGCLVNLSRVKEEMIAWVWKPYLPVGKLVLIDGDGAAGKTTLLLDIAARMSMSKHMPDGAEVNGVGTVYVTYEDDIADTIKPRLRKAGANLNRIQVIKDVPFFNEKGEKETRPFNLSEDLELLSVACINVGASLVVIDPIMSALDGSVDSYKDQEVRKALAPLVTFAEENGVTVVMVRHYSKQKTENINHKGIGSVAFVNMSRVGLAVMPDPDEDGGMLLMHTKHNLTKEAKSLKYKIFDDGDDVAQIAWNGTSDLTQRQIMSTTKPSEPRQEIMNMLSRLDEDVDGIESKYIEQHLETKGYSRSAARMTLKRMRDEGVIGQTARGKYHMPRLAA